MLDWIINNWDKLLTIYGGVVAGCSSVAKFLKSSTAEKIVNYTKWNWDNNFLLKIRKIIDLFSTVSMEKTKE